MEAVLVIVMIVAIDLAIISGFWVATALYKTLAEQNSPADIDVEQGNGDEEGVE